MQQIGEYEVTIAMVTADLYAKYINANLLFCIFYIVIGCYLNSIILFRK